MAFTFSPVCELTQIARRRFLKQAGGFATISAVSFIATGQISDRGVSDWKNPPSIYRPQTRWWWPGNAVSKIGIEAQLNAMKAAGVGGVEILSTQPVYEKGNIPYLSDNYFKLVQFTVEHAKLLDLSVSLGFGAAGDFARAIISDTERSQCLVPEWLEINGPQLLNKEIFSQGKLLAVVAARRHNKGLEEPSLTILNENIATRRLKWEVPTGSWLIGFFHLQPSNSEIVHQEFITPSAELDRFNPQAVKNYINRLGNLFSKRLGKYFGTKITSFFVDDLPAKFSPNSLPWSDHLLTEFKARLGYDLTRYLPMLWNETELITQRVRYDLNGFLAELEKKVYFSEISKWCESNKLKAKIKSSHWLSFGQNEVDSWQATGDNVSTTTLTHFTSKVETSAERFYGHLGAMNNARLAPQAGRYRLTLEELKRTADAYFRDGVTRFLNYGWTYSEEIEVAPERDLSIGTRIHPWMPWFKHYRNLSDYLGRCSWLLRQGSLVADILIYQPQNSLWPEPGVKQSLHSLLNTLVANGYDFELVNDELIQNAEITQQRELNIRQHLFRILILPKAINIPLATLRKIEAFAKARGIVIALDRFPELAAGLKSAALWHDVQVFQISQKLFEGGNNNIFFLPDYKLDAAINDSAKAAAQIKTVLTAPQKKLIEILHELIPPDVSLPDDVPSEGLTFVHRRDGERDIYFLTNLSTEIVTTVMSFRVTGKRVDLWDAISGEVKQLPEYRTTMKRTEVPLTLQPWESLFLIFSPNVPPVYVTRTDLAIIETIRRDGIIAYATREGEHSVVIARGMSRNTLRAWAPTLPQSVLLGGEWNFTASGTRFPSINKKVSELRSWAESEDTRYFSGEGIYELTFMMGTDSLPEDVRWILSLGKVAETAEVTLNNKLIGVRWMQPYDFDVTRELVKGENRLRVAVTNTLHNRVVGLNPTTDLPSALKNRHQKTANQYTLGATTWRDNDLNYPLLPSGLLGPVRLIPQGIVLFKL